MKPRIINTTWIALCMCGVNLCFMHATCLYTDMIEDDIEFTAISDCLLGIVVDVTFLFALIYLLTLRHLKATLVITFMTTLCWAFANILYARFFHHNLTLSAMEQGGTLLNAEMIKCVLNGLRWSDLLLMPYLWLCWATIRKATTMRHPVTKILLFLLATAMVDIFCHIGYCSVKSEYRYVNFMLKRFEHRQMSTHLQLCSPNHATFRRGCVRSLLQEAALSLQGNMKLGDDQLRIISNKITEARGLINNDTIVGPEKNIIVIIVESYMSFTSDMTVDGKEITPCLNALKRDSMVYYNGNMHENVTIGESSDGQFIYMTGILPLRSVITVSKARSVTLPGLPKMTGRRSRMVIPTMASMWNQDGMCKQYGFDSLYTSDDFKGLHGSFLNDEQVFQLAMEKDQLSTQPFLSVILTMTMHQPYTEQPDTTFPVNSPSLPQDLRCYLNVCHYTDRQIGRYLAQLKKAGLYDNSLIVIVADHPVHNTDFGGVSKYIPLYIVNIGGLQRKMWQGECNQLDVYTTLADLIGAKSNWCGLGRSLLSTEYENTITTLQWNVSEWIIMGNYFATDN